MAKKKISEEEKQTKVRAFKTELDKVFIIILVLFILCGIGYAGYTMYKNGGINFLSTKKDKKDKDEKETGDVIETEVDGIAHYQLGNAFVYSINNAKLTSIYDNKGELLIKYDEPVDYQYYYYDLKDNLNLVQIDWGEGTTNNITVHTIADGKDKVVLELEGSKSYFTALVKMVDQNDYKLIGFVETINAGDDYTYKIHYLDGKEVDLSSYAIRSVGVRLDADTTYTLYDEKYAVVSDNNQKDAKYGIMDLTTGELVVGLNYTLLRQTWDGLYIAKLDGKLGLIDLKTKKILPYEYDFIEPHKDYYIVSKDNKLSLLNKDYRSITGFEFDYQKYDKDGSYIYDVCCSSFNSFYSKKVKDKYLLVINYNSMEVADALTAYDKEESYIINEDGKYETVSEIDFGGDDTFTYFLDPDERNIHIYDDGLNYLYDISLKEYDFKARDLQVEKYGDNLLVVKADGTTLYFDYKTGEEAEDKVATYKDGTFKYDLGTKTVTFKNGNIKEFKFTGNGRVDKIEENSYFITDNERFVIVK